MFGRKKNKKQNDVYTGLYVVKDVDNIISIAQSYGISWKELAKINNIDPPYILISGETISVPDEKSDVDEREDIQVSNSKSSEDATKPTDVKNARTQESNKKFADGIKSDTQVTQESIKSQTAQKLLQQKDIISNTKKKTRKITYASPKNMLHKPSAEPTMQAIDITWMQDDEETYSEEIQLQRKKINIWFIVISILLIIISGSVVWWGVTWFLKQNNNKNVSVQTLIKKNNDVKKNKTKEIVLDNNESTDKNKKEDESIATEGGKDISEIENVNKKEDNNGNEQQNEVATEKITVQILNAGAKVGTAGEVTKIFAEKGYKTNTARNAKNDYKGVVIYYSEDNKNNLDIVAKNVAKKYGTQKYEKSDEVAKKYEADFVVVLGS